MADEPALAPSCPRNRYRSSADVSWDTQTEEIFHHAGVSFDVIEVKKYLASHPVPVRYVPVKNLGPFLQGESPETTGQRAAVLFRERLGKSDPDVPLVFAKLPGGDLALVDGNHRLERARRSGCDRVPAVIVPIRASAKASRDLTPPRFWREAFPPKRKDPAVAVVGP